MPPQIPLFRSRYALAMLGGLVLTSAFPNIGVAGMAWIGPGILAGAALGKSGGERFRIGYAGALVHYLSILYWVLLIPYRWHGLPLAPAAGWLAMSGVLALFPATWVALVAAVHRGAPKAPSEPLAQSLFGTSDAQDLRGVLARGWARRMCWALGGAASWVAFEMVLARFLGGFPWNLLGVSQYRMAPLIQMSSITGVYGVSFLVAWGSLSLLSAALMVIRRPTARSVWVGEVLLPLLVVAVVFNLGTRHLRSQPAAEHALKVALVQPSIPQTVIWNASDDTNRFRHVLELSEAALTNRPDLLVWPESAVPEMIRYDQATFDAITGLAHRHHVWIILGSDDAEPRRNAVQREENYFNSSFLVSPEGQLRERYIKRNLVMFGEYVPFQHWLPFLKYFTPIQGGFTPGTRPVPFELRDLGVRTSVLICYEDTFPQLGRDSTGPDTDFLVNITNDGWFDEGAEQWQHATTALFRAVENHVPLLRCCNNGLTCWIDSDGRLRDIFRDDHGTIYGPGFMTIEVPLAPPGTARALTFYTRNGDVFGWICVGICGLMILGRWARRG